MNASSRAGIGQLTDVPVDLIDLNPHQPRTDFDDTRQEELNRSVAEVGVLQPVLVRPSADGRYELIAGERRLRAVRAAGQATVPARVRDTADREMLPLAIAENLHRSDLNPIELAGAYDQLLRQEGLTQGELAEVVHVDRTQVSRTLSLLRLPDRVQRRVAAGVLSASHGELLAGIPDPTVCELLADRIVAEGLSVSSVREIILVGGLPGAETIDGREAARRLKQRRPAPAGFTQAAESLEDRLDTRVRVVGGKSRGRIVVDFAGAEDLRRILGLLGVSG